MKGARWIRIAGVGNGNGPRRGLREDELCPENIYQIYHEAIKESSKEQSKKFKKRFKERFKERFDEGLNEITQDQFSIISIFEEMLKKRVEAITQDQFSEIFSDKKIDLLFDQLNSANLEEHLSMINQNKWQTYNSDDKIPENLQKNDREPPRESWGEETYKKLCFSCYSYRRKNLKEKPKNLPELLKKINPYCDPDEEKIKKVLEEYKKYKELDGGEEDLQNKTALKKAIKDALSIDKSKLPSINEEHLEELKNTLIKKIDLALSPNSESKKGGDDISTSLDLQCKQAFQDILFQKTQSTSSEEQDLTQPRKILKTSDEFNEFLAKNGGTNLSENKVKEAFNEYRIYYNTTLGQSDISVKLKKSQEIQSNGVSDHEFNGIVSFLNRMPEAELNASLVFHKPSAQVVSMEELEPLPEAISDSNIKRDKVVDIKHDKVAEFKKFLHDNNLHCNQNDIQKIFALHELYEAYQRHVEKSESEIQGGIFITTKNLEAFKNKIGELIFKKELSESHQLGFVPISSLKEVRVRLDQNKLEEILTFLNENRKSEKIDSGWETSNPPLDLHDDSETIVKNVELFKKNKKVAITERLASWYSKGEEDDKIQEAFIAYEAYANATSIQDKQNLKAIILFKLTEGDQDVSKNLGALEFLKILDELNKYHAKAEQEKPNEIIKFFFKDLPSTILGVFDCTRTNSENGKGPR